MTGGETSKMVRSVVWAALLGCLDPVLTILGASSGRDPFQLPQDTGGKACKGGGKRSGSWGYLSGLLRKLKKELVPWFGVI